MSASMRRLAATLGFCTNCCAEVRTLTDVPRHLGCKWFGKTRNMWQQTRWCLEGCDGRSKGYLKFLHNKELRSYPPNVRSAHLRKAVSSVEMYMFKRLSLRQKGEGFLVDLDVTEKRCVFFSISKSIVNSLGDIWYFLLNDWFREPWCNDISKQLFREKL